MKTLIVKKYDDIELIDGNYYDCDSSWTFIDKDPASEIKVYNEDNVLLCILVKQAISKELCDLAIKCYKKAGQTVSTNRGYAAGMNSNRKNTKHFEQGIPSNSGVIGYLDSPNHKRPCRLTAYSREFFDKYTEGIEFISTINECYKKYVPEQYGFQYEEAIKTPDFIIKHNNIPTAFSTITINYNFRTALHKDSGDYNKGFGNIVAVSENVNGGYLLLPEYKCAILLNTGDYLALNVHEYHCNSKINILEPDGFRLSFVCYLREKIVNCPKINERLLGITGSLDGKLWDTNKIFNDIFENNVPNKVYNDGDNTNSWSLENDKYRLIYKNKRYVLYDKIHSKKVHNLLPSWDYVKNI